MPLENPIEYFNIEAWLSPHDAVAPAGPVTHPELPKESGITIWETLKREPNFSRITSLVSSFPDLVSLLNGNEECTLFAVSNDILQKPYEWLNGSLLQDLYSSELSDILRMHISPHYMPSTYMSTAPNLPVLFSSASLNGAMVINCQPLSEQKFLLQNTTHTTDVDLLCFNGVIHTLDNILIPPPPSLKILSLLPETQFSTFQKALSSTGLTDQLSKSEQRGGILFIPTNSAFQNLGSSATEFLFAGTKISQSCLSILLRYHIILNETFYSNIHFKNPALSYDYEHAKLEGEEARKHALRHISGVRRRKVTSWLGPFVHLDLKRDGGKIDIKVNGTEIRVRDGNARDGVLHVLDQVLIPPSLMEEGDGEGDWGREWTGDELRGRLEEWLRNGG